MSKEERCRLPAHAKAVTGNFDNRQDECELPWVQVEVPRKLLCKPNVKAPRQALEPDGVRWGAICYDRFQCLFLPSQDTARGQIVVRSVMNQIMESHISVAAADIGQCEQPDCCMSHP